MVFFIYIDMVSHICFNGKMIPDTKPVLLSSNRSYKYGDGLFETMHVENGKIPLINLHMERLFAGIALLEFQVPAGFTANKLIDEITGLFSLNGCGKSGRARLSVFRGNGNLNEDPGFLEYLIECEKIPHEKTGLHARGLQIDIFPFARKSQDKFSNLKSAAFLPYVMAARYAKQNKLDDCLLLNSSGNIADSTIANIFIIKDQKIFTPALTQGCVQGVMRKFLLEFLDKNGYKITEGIVTPEQLSQADEIFLTNAIKKIQWVQTMKGRTYQHIQTKEIYDRFLKTFP